MSDLEDVTDEVVVIQDAELGCPITVMPDQSPAISTEQEISCVFWVSSIILFQNLNELTVCRIFCITTKQFYPEVLRHLHQCGSVIVGCHEVKLCFFSQRIRDGMCLARLVSDLNIESLNIFGGSYKSQVLLFCA